jgi:glutamine synthetase
LKFLEHEVAAAGQCEIDFRFGEMMDVAGNLKTTRTNMILEALFVALL